MNQQLKIQVLTDDLNAWIVPHSQQLTAELKNLGHQAQFIHEHDSITNNDILFILGCKKIIPKNYLLRSKKNLLVHESALPQGRGWAPMTYQVLEGKNEITFSLLEASEKADEGDIYLQEILTLNGSELCDELRLAQGQMTLKLCLKFVEQHTLLRPKHQLGPSSYYDRRTPKDSELDINKTIKEQFNLLRVCDNERYPAFFVINGKKYTIKTYKN